ncbi:hypothetical protein D3C80_1405010 [compost metagenome]
MARSQLILLCLLLTGCATTEQRVTTAAKTEGEARAVIPFPDPPASCVAKIGRVRIGDEPWVVTFRRWEVVADIRDQQAADCAAWFADMKENWN